MSNSIPALNLPIQLFALGTATGMFAALIRYHRTGGVEHWPVYVACPALMLFAVGVLIVCIDALP
jgi:hypothetical protein